MALTYNQFEKWKDIASYFDGLITKQYKGLKKYLGEHAQKHTVFTHIIKFSPLRKKRILERGRINSQ